MAINDNYSYSHHNEDNVFNYNISRGSHDFNTIIQHESDDITDHNVGIIIILL